MKKYLTVFFTLSFFAIFSVFFANFFFDPFFLKSSPSLLQYRDMPDERQNKTNLMINATPTFDALLIGSSRSSYIRNESFKKSHIFNYSADSMYPAEYLGFIKLAYSKRPFKKLYIGLDFFGSNNTKNPQAKPAEDYIQIANKRLIQNLDFSGINLILQALSPEKSYHEYYNQKFNKMFLTPSDKEYEKNSLYLLKQYKETLYTPKTYVFNPNLGKIFDEIVAFCKAHAIELKVFTTPESAPLFSLMVKTKFLPFYEQWIRLGVQKFGGLYDFMGLNSVTTNLNNYADTHHFSPGVGHSLVAALEGRMPLNPNKNMGAYVTKDTLESHLANIRKQAEGADKDPIGTFEKLVTKDS